MNARLAATTNAITLAQIGMANPFTTTSQPKTTRINCNNATSVKTITEIAVKGFIAVSLFDESLYSQTRNNEEPQ